MPGSAPHMSCSLSTWSLDLRTHHVNLLIYQPAVELKVWSKDAIRNQAVLKEKKNNKGNESTQFMDKHDLDGYSFIQNNYVNKNWHETHGNVHINKKGEKCTSKIQKNAHTHTYIYVYIYMHLYSVIHIYIYISIYISLKVAYLISVLCADEISWATF